MSLATRLMAPVGDEEKIPVHQFMAVMAELQRGVPGVNQTSIAQVFGLTQTERGQLTTFITRATDAQNPLTREMIHDILLLGEYGIYTVEQALTRLGL